MTAGMPWLTAVRDHPDRPRGCATMAALTVLALRLDWRTGTGYASVAQLADDSGASAATVRRALDWAMRAGLLTRTRRGHRVTADRVAASEWKLTQPLTREQLATDPTAHHGRANRSPEPTQPLTTDAPSRPVSIETCNPSLSRTQSVRAQLAALGASKRETAEIVERVRANPRVSNPYAYLAAALDNGDGRALLDQIRADPGDWTAVTTPWEGRPYD